MSRAELLDVTARLLARRRIGDVSMAELAAAAGVSKGLLYLRFADRDALFRALVDREFRETLAAVRAAIEADDKGGLLSQVYLHTVAALRARPMMFRLYTGQADDLATFVRTQLPERYAPRVAAGRRYIDTMRKSGMIRTDLDGQLDVVLSTVAIGIAAGATVLDVEDVIAGVAALIASGIDADVADTTPGKAAFGLLADELLALVPDPTAVDPVRSGSAQAPDALLRTVRSQP